MTPLLVLIFYPLHAPRGSLPLSVCIPVTEQMFDAAVMDEKRTPEAAAALAKAMLFDCTADKHQALAHLALQVFTQSEDTCEFAVSDEWAAYAQPGLHVSISQQNTLHFRAEDFATQRDEAAPGERPLTVAAATPLRSKPRILIH